MLDTGGIMSEFFKQVAPYLSTIALSVFGGTVQYLGHLRSSKSQVRWSDFLIDITISAFAGFLTFKLCAYGHVESEMSSILIAVSGHMGTRAVRLFEKFYTKAIDKMQD